MPAPPLSNTLSNGVDGVDVATSDPGSPNSFQLVTATPPKYTNVQFHSSPLSMRWLNVVASHWCAFQSLGSLTSDVYTRVYLFLPSLPSDNNFYPIAFRTNADASCAILRILSTGIIQMRNAANSQIGNDSLVPVATNQWVRIETRVKASATVGEMEWRLYNSADSLTYTDTSKTIAGAVLGANLDAINFGTNVTFPAAGITFYFDDLAVSTTDWVGPSIVSSGFIPRPRRRSNSVSW